MDRRELADKSFACLPGCGFCCTFQPEVSLVELRGLRKALPFVPLAAAGGRTYLGLQGGQGACSLLKDRQCTAYDARPAHCRYFPFHVYWGERTEVYVDLSCRGVIEAPGTTLDAAFAASGAEADAAARADGPAEARKAHRRFRDLAAAEEAWQEPGPVVEALAAAAATWTTGAGLERLAAAAGEEARADDLASAALEPFEGPVKARPFWLDPDLRWRTFERDGDALVVADLREDGQLDPGPRVEGLARHADAPPAVREALVPYVRRLLARDVFRGSAYARVDDHCYAFGVAEALHARAAEVGADLALRARLVAALRPELGAAAVADEVVRFYDADFLDAETIGGFL